MTWLTSHVSYAPVIEVVDVDGDGATDLAVPDQQAQRVGWLPAPPGVLREAGQAAEPRDLDAADVDNDGDLDLVVTAADGAWWFEQTAPGAFTSHLVASTYQPPYGAALGDVDGDGVPDLVLAERYGLSLHLGTGAGFTSAGFIDFDACSSPILADLDGDGVLDLVALRSGVRWYQGLGGGTFSAPVDLGANAGSVVVADLDGDADPDVAWSGYAVPVAWAENVGGGTFRNPVALVSGALDGQGALAAADLDGVAGQELIAAVGRRVVGYYGPDYVDLRVRAFSWATGTVTSVDLWDLDARTLAAGDLDGDGLADLVAFQATTLEVEPAVWVRTADGAGGWSAAVEWSDGVVTNGAGFAELDGDGLLDVATLSVTDQREVRSFPGAGPGVFGRSFDLGRVLPPGGTFRALDPDGDGVDELLVSGRAYSAAGSLGAPVAVSGPVAEVADVDLDGDPDVVDCDSADVHRYDLGVWTTTPSATPPAALVSGCRLRDLTGDGAPELIAWWYLDVTVRENAGDGTFSPAVTLPFAVDVVDLDVGDLDGDGDLDLAMADFNQLWISSQAGGSLGAPVALAGDSAESVVVRDWDLDGDADVATVGDLGRVDVYLQAAGALAPAVQVADLRGQAWFADAGDADGDGDDDLLFAFNALRGSGVLLNPTNSPEPPPPPEETADTGLLPPGDHTGEPTVPDPTAPTGDSADKPGPDEGGCGCASGGSAGAGWIALVVLGLRRRRTPRG